GQRVLFSNYKCCHKKFCDLCLHRYMEIGDVIKKMEEQRKFKAGIRNTFVWICPACKNICSCASCKRKRYGHSQFYSNRTNTFFNVSEPVTATESIPLNIITNEKQTDFEIDMALNRAMEMNFKGLFKTENGKFKLIEDIFMI
ncbi:hypothetical protein MHBO_001236, partial [Bonamia ostreae]